MGCQWVKLADGTVMHIKYSGKRPPYCQFCRQRPATKLCDAPVPVGDSVHTKTCDASMCAVCATNAGKDLDYCPRHKASAPQGGLY